METTKLAFGIDVCGTPETPQTHKPQYRIQYIECGLDTSLLRKNIQKAAHDLKEQKFEFESIAFRGMSGALFSPPLALELNKTMVLVRKKGDGSHSMFRIEGDIGSQKYIIVDDFIASGATVQTIILDIHTLAPDMQCIGILELRMHHTNKNGLLKLRSPNRFLGKSWKKLKVDDSDENKYYV